MNKQDFKFQVITSVTEVPEGNGVFAVYDGDLVYCYDVRKYKVSNYIPKEYGVVTREAVIAAVNSVAIENGTVSSVLYFSREAFKLLVTYMSEPKKFVASSPDWQGSCRIG